MKTSNQLATDTINMIIDEWHKLPDNGFQLHIEDWAPEWALTKAAGQKTDDALIGLDRTPIKEVDLPESVKKALGLLASNALHVYGGAVPVEVAPPDYDGEVVDTITIYYEEIIHDARDEDDLRRMVREYVRHEWRHGCQFVWLRQHGLSPLDALISENGTLYGCGPLESDAHSFQRGVENPLDEAMRSFIA